MSRFKLELCSCVIKDNYGELVEKVAMFIAKNGPSQLKTIIKRTGCSVKQVKEALAVLIVQNMASFRVSEKSGGVTEYSCIIGNIISRVRFEKYILCVKKRHGDIAELMLNELLLHGQTTVDQVVDSVVEKLGTQEITANLVRDKFKALLNSGLVCQCLITSQGVAHSSSEPAVVSAVSVAGRKRKRLVADTCEGQPEVKKAKTETSLLQVADMTNAVYMANYETLDRCICDQLITDAVASRNGKAVSQIVATILQLCRVKSPPLAPKTNPVSYNELWQVVAKEQNMSQSVFSQWLKILTDDASCFVCREGDSGGGMYSINFKSGFTELAMAHIESVVNERFGSKARRIFRLLYLKKRLEQKQIEVLSMIHPKEAKELLYRMFEDHYVSLTEVPRGSEYLTSKVIYLFCVDLPQVARMLIDTCCKSLANLLCRRTHETNENAPLLRQQAIMEAVIAKLEEQGTDEEVIASYKEQMTYAQRLQLENFNKTVNKLDCAAIQAEETLFLLQTYLTYAYLK